MGSKPWWPFGFNLRVGVVEAGFAYSPGAHLRGYFPHGAGIPGAYEQYIRAGFKGGGGGFAHRPAGGDSPHVQAVGNDQPFETQVLLPQSAEHRPGTRARALPVPRGLADWAVMMAGIPRAAAF